MSTVEGPVGQRPAGAVPQGALSLDSTSLTEGEILSGRILRTAGEGSYLARFQSGTLLVKSNIPLRPGQMLTVRVAPGKAGLEMEVLKVGGDPKAEGAPPSQAPPPAAPAPGSEAAVFQRVATPQGMLGGRLGALSDLVGRLLDSPHGRNLPADIVQSLKAVRSPFISAAGEEMARQLSGIFAFLGLNLESELAKLLGKGIRKVDGAQLDSMGLKWKLMKLISRLESSNLDSESAGNLKEILREARALLKSLEQVQVQNARFHGASYLYLELPVSPKEGFERAQLEFFYRTRGDGKEIDPENCTVVFTLDMSRLGRLRVRMAVREGQVSGTIETKNEDVAGFIREDTSSLNEALEARGYKSAMFHVWEGGGTPDPLPTLLSDIPVSRINVEA